MCKVVQGAGLLDEARDLCKVSRDMPAGKLARVTAFSKEQGFGRVAITEEGELAFDVSVAQCAIDSLTV